MNLFMKKLLILFSIIFITSSCGIYKYSDARKNPVNANERVQKNMEEGKGFRLGNLGGKKGGDFMFSSANPMWRASLDKLSFAPLSVVDYGGGVIITDWFSEEGTSEEIKLTVRFLTNEIRSDAIKIIIHKRNCTSYNNCKITSIDNSTNNEIKFTILRKAAEIEKQDLVKTKDDIGEYKIPGKNF